jgi:hypothetical protein
MSDLGARHYQRVTATFRNATSQDQHPTHLRALLSGATKIQRTRNAHAFDKPGRRGCETSEALAAACSFPHPRAR